VLKYDMLWGLENLFRNGLYQPNWYAINQDWGDGNYVQDSKASK